MKRCILPNNMTITQELLLDIESLGIPRRAVRSVLVYYFDVYYLEYARWMAGYDASSAEIKLLFKLKKGLSNLLIKRKMGKERFLRQLFEAIETEENLNLIRHDYLTDKFNAGPSSYNGCEEE